MHGTKRKFTRRFQVYDPEVNEKYYKVVLGYYPDAWCSYWSVQYIRKNQQELLVFIDRKGQLIGYGDVDLTGLDGGGDKNEAPIKIENENDLDYQDNQEDIHPYQEEQTIWQTVKVEL